MKLAILLFGHMRTFQECSTFLKSNLLENYDCDIFIHTWDITDTNRFTDKNVEVTLNRIEEIYQPKSIKVEKQNFIEELGEYSKDQNSTLKKHSVPLHGLKYMLHSMHEAYLLKTNYQKIHNIKYDYVILIRPDVKLNSEFNLNNYLKEFIVSPNTVISFSNYPSMLITTQKMQQVYKASDIFLLFSEESITKYLEDFNFFEKFYIEYPKLFPTYSFHPEMSFHESIVRRGLSHQFYLYNYTVVRVDHKNNIIVCPADHDLYLNIKGKNNIKYRKYFKISILVIILLLILLVYVSIA